MHYEDEDNIEVRLEVSVTPGIEILVDPDVANVIGVFDDFALENIVKLEE